MSKVSPSRRMLKMARWRCGKMGSSQTLAMSLYRVFRSSLSLPPFSSICSNTLSYSPSSSSESQASSCSSQASSMLNPTETRAEAVILVLGPYNTVYSKDDVLEQVCYIRTVKCPWQQILPDLSLGMGLHTVTDLLTSISRLLSSMWSWFVWADMLDHKKQTNLLKPINALLHKSWLC